jgi:hypothetical protein
MKKLGVVTTMLAIALLAGCSSEPSKPAEKPQPKPPEFITGRSAFQKLYGAAHGWAPDAKPFRIESRLTADDKGQGGKSAVWRASFASALQHSAKPYEWSGTNAADAPARGVSPGVEDSYTPSNSSTQTFEVAFIKVDSDQAFEVAQKHGGDKLLEKNPDTPVLYLLDWSRPTSELIWHVFYGSSGDDAKLKVDVNGTSGEFIRVEK